MPYLLIYTIPLLLTFSLNAATQREGGNVLMPLNCGELLPDSSPFINFFGAVATATVTSDRQLSKRLLRLMSLRDRIRDTVDTNRIPNPIDTLIQKTICYYREQKEPLKPVTPDDAAFLKFIKGSIRDLETKVEDTIFQVEYEKFQKQEFERRAEKARSLVGNLEKEADRDADDSYDRLSNAARRKARVGQ